MAPVSSWMCGNIPQSFCDTKICIIEIRCSFIGCLLNFVHFLFVFFRLDVKCSIKRCSTNGTNSILEREKNVHKNIDGDFMEVAKKVCGHSKCEPVESILQNDKHCTVFYFFSIDGLTYTRLDVNISPLFLFFPNYFLETNIEYLSFRFFPSMHNVISIHLWNRWIICKNPHWHSKSRTIPLYWFLLDIMMMMMMIKG